MKRIMSTILAITLVLSMSASAFASDKALQRAASPIDKSMFVEHTIEFPKLQSTKTAEGYLSFALTSSSKSANIGKSKNLVKSLNLDSALEEIYIDELNQLSKEGTYLESYTVYTTKASTRDASFGSYNGHNMQYSLSEYTFTEEYTEENVNKMQQWVEGSLDLALCFTPWQVNVPVLFLSSIDDSPTIHTGAFTKIYATQTVTNRVISVQDLMNKYGLGTDWYAPALRDQYKWINSYAILHPNNPAVDPYYKNAPTRDTVTTSNFYSNTTTKKNAFNQYMTSMDIRVEEVPTPEVEWK